MLCFPPEEKSSNHEERLFPLAKFEPDFEGLKTDLESHAAKMMACSVSHLQRDAGTQVLTQILTALGFEERQAAVT